MLLDRHTVAGREKRAILEVNVNDAKRLRNGLVYDVRQSPCKKPALEIHLHEPISSVVVAEHHRAVLVGRAISAQDAVLIEVRRRIRRPLEVGLRLLALAARNERNRTDRADA